MDFRFNEVTINGGFLHDLQEQNRKVTIHAVYDRFADTGRFDALHCAWKEGDEIKPHIFWDSDVAKWIEGAAYIIAKHPDAALEEKIEGLTDEEKAAILAGAAETDAEGIAKFEEMPVGVYLVVYTGGGRYHFDPVLLYLPYTNEDGTAWEGDVAASPKVSYDKPDKPDKPDEPDVPDTPDTPDEPDDPGEEIPDDPTPTGGKDPGEELDEPDVPMGGLPQTGLLQWPVPVMTVAGLVLIAAGLLSERKRKA